MNGAQPAHRALPGPPHAGVSSYNFGQTSFDLCHGERAQSLPDALRIVSAAVRSCPSASAPSATVSAAPASGSAAQLSQQEKLLLVFGYKPEMRNGEKVYRTRDAALGTRLVAQKTCGTPAELAAAGRQTQDDVGQTRRHETIACTTEDLQRAPCFAGALEEGRRRNQHPHMPPMVPILGMRASASRMTGG